MHIFVLAVMHVHLAKQMKPAVVVYGEVWFGSCGIEVSV